MLKAGIIQAKGMICCLSSDADNVFTVLTGRELNPDLYIVSRAISDKADVKLRKAGADNTVSPNEIGGIRMASLVLRPAVVSFLDVLTHAGDVILDLEEVEVTAGSPLRGLSLAEARIPELTGLIVIALSKHGGKLLFNPKSELNLSEGDRMVVLGSADQVEKLRGIAYR